MRTDITSELLRGSVDKFGKVRDAEKRAVLITLDRLFAFIPTVKAQYEQLKAKKDELAKKMEIRTGIHGRDDVGLSNVRGKTPF